MGNLDKIFEQYKSIKKCSSEQYASEKARQEVKNIETKLKNSLIQAETILISDLTNKIKTRRADLTKANELLKKGNLIDAYSLVKNESLSLLSNNLQNRITNIDELRNLAVDHRKDVCVIKKGVYTIDFNIYVPSQCILILEPGVKWYFTKDAGITCEGRIEARGENKSKVLLTAKDKTKGWGNFYLRGGIATLDHTLLSYGKGRLDKFNKIYGGAIYLEATETLSPLLTINNSDLNSNSADYGGAIYISQGKAKIGKNNIFRNNSAREGGAIFNQGGTLDFNELDNIFKNNRPNNFSKFKYD